jgi:hypothetical protein
VTVVLGLAARGRPAAPYGRAKRSLRQSGGENTGRTRHAATQRGLQFLSLLTKPVFAGSFGSCHNARQEDRAGCSGILGGPNIRTFELLT